MDEDRGGDAVVVARVRVALADGSEETWLAPTRLADDALSFVADVFPPAGAAVLGVEALRRPAGTRVEVAVARADVEAP